MAAQTACVEPTAIKTIDDKRIMELDLADGEASREATNKHRPNWVINAGAFMAVDRCESEPELAKAVNAGAPEAFAQALVQIGVRFL